MPHDRVSCALASAPGAAGAAATGRHRRTTLPDALPDDTAALGAAAGGGYRGDMIAGTGHTLSMAPLHVRPDDVQRPDTRPDRLKRDLAARHPVDHDHIPEATTEQLTSNGSDLQGTGSLRQTELDGTFVCSGTYDIVATRQ